jgi:hypothetical protein
VGGSQLLEFNLQGLEPLHAVDVLRSGQFVHAGCLVGVVTSIWARINGFLDRGAQWLADSKQFDVAFHRYLSPLATTPVDRVNTPLKGKTRLHSKMYPR